LGNRRRTAAARTLKPSQPIMKVAAAIAGISNQNTALKII